jgi:hypothetical protein
MAQNCVVLSAEWGLCGANYFIMCRVERDYQTKPKHDSNQFMLNKKIGLIAVLAGLAASEVMAQTLIGYTPGDVLIGFRSSADNDLVVDAGPIATLTNAAVNSRTPISQYNNSQLALVGVNSASWSAFASQSDYTLFITKPRGAATLDKQTTPWNNASGTSLQSVAGRIGAIVTGATNNLAAFGVNTSSAVVEANITLTSAFYTTGLSYRDSIVGVNGSQANFATSFQGVPENTTPNNFSTAGKVARSDFYQVSPTGVGAAKFLGYFELDTTGALTYVAYPSAVPVFKNVSRTGNVTSIDYTTGQYGTYTLRATNSAGLSAPRTNWPAITVLTSGNTAVHTATDTTTATDRFYTITAQ